MSTKPRHNTSQNKTKQSPKKRDWSFYAIIVCLVIIAIPASYFGYQGLKALSEGRKPILGDRFKGQFDNVITDAQRSDIEAKIGALDHVESVSSTLITGTLRVAIVTNSDISKESLNGVSASSYAVVVDNLPIEDYFKDSDSVERYDLEIAVHNGLIDDEEQFMLQTGTRNAGMDEVTYQFLTTPQSQSWVDEMWERQKEKDENANKKETPVEEENAG